MCMLYFVVCYNIHLRRRARFLNENSSPLLIQKNGFQISGLFPAVGRRRASVLNENSSPLLIQKNGFQISLLFPAVGRRRVLRVWGFKIGGMGAKRPI